MAGYPIRLPSFWQLWQTAGITLIWLAEPLHLFEESQALRFLPNLWKSYLTKLQQPSRTVWTYWHLGDDVFGRPHAGRRALAQRFIQSLGWPKGSIAWWPVSEPQVNLLVASPAYFWQGIRFLAPMALVFFGDKALQAAMSDPGIGSLSVLLELPRLSLPEFTLDHMDEVGFAACIDTLRSLELVFLP
ncbi:hypothetical protein DSUL_90048 [Desulfovibrionales bacterium]